MTKPLTGAREAIEAVLRLLDTMTEPMDGLDTRAIHRNGTLHLVGKRIHHEILSCIAEPPAVGEAESAILHDWKLLVALVGENVMQEVSRLVREAAARAPETACPLCNGTGSLLRPSFGRLIPRSCSACKGTGQLRTTEGGNG